MQRTADEVKKMTGYKTVAVLPGSLKHIKTDEAFYDVSPEEFIGLYQNSSAVVSGSFHGSALGYLFKKPTYAAVRKSGSGRVLDLARLLGADRFCIGEEDTVPAPGEFDVNAVQTRIKLYPAVFRSAWIRSICHLYRKIHQLQHSDVYLHLFGAFSDKRNDLSAYESG